MSKLFKDRKTTWEASKARAIREGFDTIPEYTHVSPFYATRNLFREYLEYTGPMSYEEWLSVEDDNKAAVLFVQFFEQITLAWHKCKSFYTLEEDGVSTVLQYLIKNTPIIIDDPKRFRPAYIYKVAYNCLYCICHDIKRDRDRFENEVSNICRNGDNDELDLFDTVVSDETVSDLVNREGFWALIQELDSSDKDVSAVIDNLLLNKRLPAGVAAKKSAIIKELRILLAPYKELFYV